MYAWARKSSPIPPYSVGRWGAHSPASQTTALISSRSWIAARRSWSETSPLRPRFHRVASFGRIHSLTMAAVRIRMSLIRSSTVGMGFTFMAMHGTVTDALARR